ncbi:hypothetical protein PFICI_04844 [Pestalotiopsis fici W106-1]|uniref:SYO1-like TPR repeats domain-containing protein n=1 Tax=Pestalotiopsis fici (strain W106-1 / CGMCC3.15140) TaxID=1229662 RepID=W3XA30_PESFW|nr:uncharacterized protein PFICI_04844 [Pestalotiopsis fici W106-1]ETS82968.1 hypothetical protein PFICI_04844 [Pestalotiopsis fici W106-1]
MGKSRNNRNKGGQRSDPLAKPIKPPTDPELAALREKNILPVLKDLQSSDPKSRTSAANAVANIIQDTKCRKLLLREQVVHIILTETLTDASIESRAAGWEILKLLTQEEEADFCVHLFRIDILTAIEFAAKQVTESLKAHGGAFNKRSKAEQTLIFNIAEALAAIISALAEAQDDMLEVIIRNEVIVGFLFNLVTNELVSESARNSSLSCMMTLAEDNRQFVETILGDSQSNIFKHLMAFKAGNGLKAVLACGVLHNVFSAMEWDDANPGRDNSTDASLIPTLATALEAAPNNAADAADSSPVEILQMALEILASIGTALQEALQKGNKSKGRAGAGGSKGPGDEDMVMDADDDEDDNTSEKAPEEDDDDDDEMDADAMEADMDMVTGADDYPDEAAGLDDLPTLKQLIQKAIPQIVKVSNSSIGDQEAALLVRTHAFNALNNIAWTVSCLDFSGDNNTPVLAAWTPAAQLIWRESIARVLSSDTSDVSLATVVTSLAWAIARALHDKTPLSGDEPNKFMSLYHASLNLPGDAEDPFQGLGVKCIGVLGQLAMDPAPIQLNREVGVFLITVTSKLPETPAADAVEALNQIFDIYGDENLACDKEVFWKDNFLKYLEEIMPKVRTMAKKVDKRSSTELRVRADEASMNLFRFIQYKQKHKPAN